MDGGHHLFTGCGWRLEGSARRMKRGGLRRDEGRNTAGGWRKGVGCLGGALYASMLEKARRP